MNQITDVCIQVEDPEGIASRQRSSCRPCTCSAPTSSSSGWPHLVAGWTSYLHLIPYISTCPNTTHTHWPDSSCRTQWTAPCSSLSSPAPLSSPNCPRPRGSSRASWADSWGRQPRIAPSSWNLWWGLRQRRIWAERERWKMSNLCMRR